MAETTVAFALSTVLLLLICLEVGAERPAPSPVSDNVGRTVTATLEMAEDVVTAAAPKASEVGQAVKDTAVSAAYAAAPSMDQMGRAIRGTARSAASAATPMADKAGNAAMGVAQDAQQTAGSWASWFKGKLANLGIIGRGPASPVKSPLMAPTNSPGSAPAKSPRMA